KQYHAIPPALLRQGQWNIASPETTGEFSAVAWHFAKRYQQHTGIPLAIIDSTWGGTPAEAWTSLEALQYVPGYQDSALDMLENAQQWQQKFSDIEALEQQNQPLNSKHEPPSYKWKPGVLFNGMIHPLIHFPINGVIWYQGENNVGANAIYSDLFKALIKDWRAQWQTPDLPFLFVQLASYLPQKNHVQNSDWARLREAQASALTLPYTGMAVTIDIGDANDIHPRNKAEVGERLWRIAQHMVLQENVSYSGPVMQQVQPQKIAGKNVLVVSYKHIDGGLQVKGDQLAGFAIASTDGKFVHAQATIRDNKVIVSAPKIKQPVSLRYGWADNSPANLYNLAGLPALPFSYIQEG
ncbi:MAG: sialate O-acetylesterase, partial [Paraglaciecola sp.]|nr:sialate O-acetylesterase [Paraglaciecola sp.]